MLLTCPGCHHTFKHFARENTDKVKCFCGTEVPVDNEIGSILCAGYHCNIRDGMWLENIMPWHVVRDNPGMFPLWMPLPKLPNLPVPERRCMMGND